MPYVDLPNRLGALKYLDSAFEGMPPRLVKKFATLDLSAYMKSESLAGTWWESVKLYDREWRNGI